MVRFKDRAGMQYTIMEKPGGYENNEFSNKREQIETLRKAFSIPILKGNTPLSQ